MQPTQRKTAWTPLPIKGGKQLVFLREDWQRYKDIHDALYAALLALRDGGETIDYNTAREMADAALAQARREEV